MITTALDQLFQRSFERSLEAKRATLATLLPAMTAAGAVLIESYRGGGKAMFCGNGGSAADAQHLACEFVGRFLVERRPLPALALHANPSSLTAIGNDYGYDQTFSRPLEAFARPGDVVVGITTSGNSSNIVEAFRCAHRLGLRTIALTGRTGGKLREHADFLLNVPSDETPRIQECHILIGHCLCQAVEQALFGA